MAERAGKLSPETAAKVASVAAGAGLETANTVAQAPATVISRSI